MTFDVAGWLDWAHIRPGLGDKVYSERNAMKGLIGHSIVGSVASALGRFESPDRNPDGSYTSQAAASVTFINPYDGPLIQCYPVWASTWTSGGRKANTELVAIESEGGASGNFSEPLNANQVRNLLHLVADFEALTGLTIVRGGSGQTFWEHGEVATLYGYSPTACPSNRYEPFYEALGAPPEEDALKLTEAQTENLLLRVFAGSEFVNAGETRTDRLARAVAELDKADSAQSVNDLAASAIAVALDASGAVNDGMTEAEAQAAFAKLIAQARITIGGKV